jgi:hypothetical protein
MSVEQSDDSFWEEHNVGVSMTVGGLFAAAGALAMYRLTKQPADQQAQIEASEDFGDAIQEA